MFLAVFLHPIQDSRVFRQTVGGFFERIAVQFQKCEQMFVEANCFVIVAVEQAFARS